MYNRILFLSCILFIFSLCGLFFYDGSSVNWVTLLDQRLPRLIIAFVTGASLALAGAVVQSLFLNPLATQNILGITAGGSLTVTLVFITGLHLVIPILVPIGAILGCLLTLLFIYRLSSHLLKAPMGKPILAGVAFAVALIAIQNTLLYSFKDNTGLLSTFSLWESGVAYNQSWAHLYFQLPLSLIGMYGCLKYREEINILSLGEEDAINLGVNTKPIRWKLFLSISILIGGALAGMGVIAFFALLLPYLIRRLIGANNYKLLPLCIFSGATAMSTLDLILSPFDSISIGNMSAILGGIFFISLLLYPQQISKEERYA